MCRDQMREGTFVDRHLCSHPACLSPFSAPHQTHRNHLCWFLSTRPDQWTVTLCSNVITFSSVRGSTMITKLNSGIALHSKLGSNHTDIYVFPDGHYARLGDLTGCDLTERRVRLCRSQTDISFPWFTICMTCKGQTKASGGKHVIKQGKSK